MVVWIGVGGALRAAVVPLGVVGWCAISLSHQAPSGYRISRALLLLWEDGDDLWLIQQIA